MRQSLLAHALEPFPERHGIRLVRLTSGSGRVPLRLRSGLRAIEAGMVVFTMNRPRGALTARAQISLLRSDAGGIVLALPSGTRSLLLKFHLSQISGVETSVGAVIESESGEMLSPGHQDTNVSILYWAVDARALFFPGARFAIWYGRDVGEGLIV